MRRSAVALPADAVPARGHRLPIGAELLIECDRLAALHFFEDSGHQDVVQQKSPPGVPDERETMSRRRIAIGGLLLAALMCLDERMACGQPSALRDVWFTNTRAAGRAEWRSREPQQIWPRVDTFVQGKDALAILLIVFNDQRAHQVRGVRKDRTTASGPFGLTCCPGRSTLAGGPSTTCGLWIRSSAESTSWISQSTRFGRVPSRSP